MKNAHNQTSEVSALEQRDSTKITDLFPAPEAQKGSSPSQAKFAGTSNPRELRAIQALLTRPTTREHLDRATGPSNSPDLIFRMRFKGLDIPCVKVPDIDRDCQPIRRGVFYLTDSDRKKIWAAQRGGIDLTLAGLLGLAITCSILLTMRAM